jgi:nicotinamide mononucleotide adenylyltransferase
MFEMARDWARNNKQYVVVGAYLSPVGDAYKKKGLAPATHRLRMCELATITAQKSKFIMVDAWEALQTKYQPTAQVRTRGTWCARISAANYGHCRYSIILTMN